MPTTPMAPDPLQRHLAMLPDPEVSTDLWPRIDHARRRRLGRQRLATGVVAVALLAVAVVPRLSLVDAVPAPAVVAIDARDRQPTPADATRHAAAPAAVHRASTRDVRLRALDRALQAAYREGSSDAEIAQLWQARRALLDGRSGGSANGPIRI